jgi:2-polyprenyl-3-methyl-5-hydroxy-6-metoxy-1,4-benzoquinol methylase
MSEDFNKQFSLSQDYYLNQLDFVNWFRFFFLVKDVLRLRSNSVLEVGVGSGVVRSCLMPHVEKYQVLDINKNLKPDYPVDVRTQLPQLHSNFDCIIAADVLEHMPFPDMAKVLINFYGYLNDDGRLLVTIPHRRSNFLFMSPWYVPRVITVPTGFLSFGAFYRRFIKRKIWIDPSHCWEIGDGRIKIYDVEKAFIVAGFKIESFQKLIYVDYWILKK